MKVSASFFFALMIMLGTKVMAGEPFGDYSFECHTSTFDNASVLNVSGGIDPSGMYAVYLTGRGYYQKLSGQSFMAHRSTHNNVTSFVDMSSSDTTLKIFWDKNLSEKKVSYEGRLYLKGISKKGIPLACDIVTL